MGHEVPFAPAASVSELDTCIRFDAETATTDGHKRVEVPVETGERTSEEQIQIRSVGACWTLFQSFGRRPAFFSGSSPGSNAGD